MPPSRSGKVVLPTDPSSSPLAQLQCLGDVGRVHDHGGGAHWGEQERAWEGAGLRMHAENKRRSCHSSSVNITATAATQATPPVDSVLPLKSPTRAFLRASTG